MLNQRQIELPSEIDLQSLFGSFDCNLKLLEKGLGVSITARDNCIKLSGDEENVDKADEVMSILVQILEKGENIDEQKILYAITMVQESGGFDMKLLGDDCIAVNHNGSPIKTKTLGQKKYIEAIDNNTIVFGLSLIHI